MFTYHDETTAPSASVPLLQQSKKAYGFYPKLHQTMAEAPATYAAYLETYRLFTEETSLTPLEQQVVMMASNFENRCHYCCAGHTMLMKMIDAPDDVIEALRDGRKLADPKLEALRTFARDLLLMRGHVGDERLEAFLAAGYDRKQALEVLVGLSSKLLSNFTNALAHTELDDAVAPFEWIHPDQRSA